MIYSSIWVGGKGLESNMAPKRAGDLEIEEDIHFQEGEWRAERVGWVIIAAVILLALLGLFGSGPLSSASANGPQGYQVDYSRFVRMMSPTEIRIALPAEAASEGEARFWIDREYLDRFEVENIVPEPQEEEIGADRITYTILVSAQEVPANIRLELSPKTSGFFRGRAGWGEANSLTFSQFIYP